MHCNKILPGEIGTKNGVKTSLMKKRSQFMEWLFQKLNDLSPPFHISHE
jgi:hypothetical protein